MLDVFLTSFDPSDLPSASIDPLGFERGYLQLADTILPGMTNVANCPRYFGLLCAGSVLSEVPADCTPVAQRSKRLEHMQKLERLWALANVLAFRDSVDTDLSGLRGVTYAVRHADRLRERAATTTDCDFRLLIRQVPYGAVGIYGAVAETCRLLYRKTYEVTPGLGEVLGRAFLDETQTPRQIRRAAIAGGEVSLNALREWGERAHLWSPPGHVERRCIDEIVNSDPVRARFSRLLIQHPSQDCEPELTRLRRISNTISRDAAHRDMHRCLLAIVRYEVCYRFSMLAMERLLWLSRRQADASGAYRASELGRDPVLASVCERLPRAAKELFSAIDYPALRVLEGQSSGLADVRAFVGSASSGCADPRKLADAVLTRHRQVQGGKLDRGQRKMPWVQIVNNRLSLTMARVGGLTREATDPDDILPHPYRLQAADNWSTAAGIEL